MNRNSLKTYAPKARRAFIQAVTDRAALFGLAAKKVEPITEQGDVAIIGGKAFPRSVAEKRRRLEDRIERRGFAQVMEAMAYTWFNRLVAIRYMEIHGYLDHGYRVLSHPDANSSVPEIVEHAEHITLPGLKADQVIDLKLDGNKEAELYRKLLIAQCNALSAAMPFLFERIDDETELLLPDNLLHSDSIVRTLVASIEEEDWQEVEIIGWLYQFYISEKKDEVIGKVVKSEDIPAATQLFTPNWIVKYLVQNSLGRQWVATYPNSPLKGRMEYYIEPAEQTPEVQAQLDAITPGTLDPEELTLLDPACGSGHILVEAYDLLKEIYLERGYRLRDIPGLILAKNLLGLEIDDRAAQLAAFALMMTARADDRRIFDGQRQPNVLSIQESNGLDISTVVQAFTAKQVTDESFTVPGEFGFMAPIRTPLLAAETTSGPAGDDQIAADLKSLLHLFENAKTYGSLITIPESLAKRLPALATAVEKAMASGELAVAAAGRVASVFVSQAAVLACPYDNVVTNPPYLTGLFSALKAFAGMRFPDSSTDLCAMFISRAIGWASSRTGRIGMVTMHSWMYVSSFEAFRHRILNASTLQSLAHLGPGAFPEIGGAVVQVACFVLLCAHCPSYVPVCDKAIEEYGEDKALTVSAGQSRYATLRQGDFARIPDSPIAYWVQPEVLLLFDTGITVSGLCKCAVGLQTGDNNRFIRFWHEVPYAHIGFGCSSRHDATRVSSKWFPCNKGGPFRKWYGNHMHVIDWQHDGRCIRAFTPKSVIRNPHTYFHPVAAWAKVASKHFHLRYVPSGFVHNDASCFLFSEDEGILLYLMGVLNSHVSQVILEEFNPTLNYVPGKIGQVPIVEHWDRMRDRVVAEVRGLIDISKTDWDLHEISWHFERYPGCDGRSHANAETSWVVLRDECQERVNDLLDSERKLDELATEQFGLAKVVEAEPALDDVSLDQPTRSGYAEGLASYAMGCMLGRYSLDEPGLIYAHSGNEGFDPSRYRILPADKDGIVPVTEIDWFEDDAARRFEEFVAVAWPREHVEDNLTFVADSLGAKRGEQPRDTIRRYLAKSFFADHLKTYKKRPIYWLFSSGKLGAFQCLVYLHRYNEGTLARMRTEYVIPLQGKIAARIEQLEGDKAKATSASHRNRIQKEQDKLRKQQDELRTFDERLRHYADQRIALDLDDGVKVNYGKFGDLLAEVKAVTGKKKGAK